ncbi:MAG: SocA family protein [Candidatus Peribacteraceae bacterium]|nr:SocA family protein [Candidatus Peribacteraceae bacterium]
MSNANAPYKAEDIAVYFINLANQQVIDESGATEGITNLKLQKILYFAQAAHLAVHEKPLFKEEIEAWKFGPVVPSIYKKYKQYTNKVIPNSKVVLEFDEQLINFLNSIWEIYGKYSAAELVEITHQHKPWKQAFFEGKGTTVIEKAVMMSHYKGYFLPQNETSVETKKA